MFPGTYKKGRHVVNSTRLTKKKEKKKEKKKSINQIK